MKISLKPKQKSLPMILVGFFNPSFIESSWTTFLYTIYYPLNVQDKNLKYFEKQIKYQSMFVRYFHKYNLLFLLTYYIPFVRNYWKIKAYIPGLKTLLIKHKYTLFYEELNSISENMSNFLFSKKKIKEWLYEKCW